MTGRPVDTWTKERDFALTFGTAIGMSASQIAASMGDVTRNAVIGRRHRMKMGVPDRHLLPKPPKRPRAGRPPAGIPWTEEEDAILAEKSRLGIRVEELVKLLPGRTGQAIKNRKAAKGWSGYRLRRFTPEEDEIIRADYRNHVHVEETSRKLERSYGVIRQRLLTLRLSRDGRKTRLAKKWGHDVLTLSDDPLEIQRIMLQRQAALKAEQDTAHAAKVQSALDVMEKSLAEGADRMVAFRAAMISGATLQAVGTRVGITRERVRQIVGNLRNTATGYVQKISGEDALRICKGCGAPFRTKFQQQTFCTAECRTTSNKAFPLPVTVPCKHCGEPFLKTHGNAKYCGPTCAYQYQLATNPERWAQYKQKQQEAQKSPKDVVMEKLAELPAEEIISLLREMIGDAVKSASQPEPEKKPRPKKVKLTPRVPSLRRQILR